MSLSKIQYFIYDIEHSESQVLDKLKKVIHPHNIGQTQGVNMDDDEKKPEKTNIALMEKFMHYYVVLLQHGQQYAEVEALLEYLLTHFKNKCDMTISAKSMKVIFGREIYLSMTEMIDATLFINWFEKNFGGERQEEDFDDV